MERHAVPQNIMEVEFKLFGALTVRQFGYLAGGLILALIIYFTPLPGLLRFALIIISVLLGLFLSLVRINGQSSSVWLTNFIVAMFTSQERVWKKTGVVPEIFQEQVQKSREETLMKVKKQGRIKASVTPLSKFETETVITQADKEEELRLQQIEKQMNLNEDSLKVTDQSKPKPVEQEIVTPVSELQVKGYVFDKTDKPVKGALVSFNTQQGEFLKEVVTNDLGYFELKENLSPGIYFANIAAEKLKFDYYKIEIKPGQDIIYKFKAK